VILLDASVLLAAEDADDLHHADAVALLRTGALATVDLALYEVTNIAELRWRDPAASLRLRQRIWAIGEFGAIVRIDEALAERVAELMREHPISAYDAGYVAAAERLAVPLASCDERDLIAPGLASPPGALLQS
jgi:predicted nucleic acid-binding protein